MEKDQVFQKGLFLYGGEKKHSIFLHMFNFKFAMELLVHYMLTLYAALK